MLKRISIFFLPIFLMLSCYSFQKPDKPKHLISKKEMVNIILDLRLLASANGSNQKILQEEGAYSEDYVFKKYKIDSLTFALSNNYYAYYVEEYDEIYTKVKDSLELLKKNLDALVIQEEDERRKTDSINNVRKRDSLDLIRNKDSIRLINKTDSLLNIKLKNKIKPKLIMPVSDKAVQSQ